MKMSYNKLWKLLIDKNMKKSNLRKAQESVHLPLQSLARIRMLQQMSWLRVVMS